MSRTGKNKMIRTRNDQTDYNGKDERGEISAFPQRAVKSEILKK